MTTHEYAARHGLCSHTVADACAAGRIPAQKRPGKGHGRWEIIGDPEWPASPYAAQLVSLPPHLRVTAEDQRLVAKTIGLLARHWQKGMEIPLDALRDAYQALSNEADTATDIILGAHIPTQEQQEVWA